MCNCFANWAVSICVYFGHMICSLGTADGGTVVKVLCYKLEGCWFDSRWCHWNFSLIQSFQSHYGPGIDSFTNRNEYQEHFLGVKAAGAWGWQPYHYPVPLSWNLGTLTSWNPLGHSRPVMGLLYLCFFFAHYLFLACCRNKSFVQMFLVVGFWHCAT
jgi:hypothetical protein